MAESERLLCDRSLRLRRLATMVLSVLAAALGIEILMILKSGNVTRDLSYILPYRLPALFYLAGIWTIRQAFARLAKGDLFNHMLPILLRRVGLALVGGSIASAFLTQWLWRALLGPENGAWASFDPSTITVGLVGLLIFVMADLTKRAAAMRQELDEFC